MQHVCHKNCCVCAASDHVTRILKEYGDVLDKYQLAPDKADIGKELRVLRCLVLLIKLTGLFTTIFASLKHYQLFEARHVLPSCQCRVHSMATVGQSMAWHLHILTYQIMHALMSQFQCNVVPGNHGKSV